MIALKILKNQWLWLFLILIVSIILRFWDISSSQHLTYDEARDYIILKRILVDHKFTLVGPTLSIAPGFFLPPFYYYSLLPFVKIFDFHIIGPDIYTVTLGAVSVFFFYFLAKDFFGIIPAIVATFSFAINPYLVQTSKHAWNPNTIFLFSILFFLSVERYLFKKQREWFVLASFSLAWAIGLHLTAIVFIPLYLYLIFLEIKNKFFGKTTIIGITLFIFIFSPLLFFDIKHNFPISKAGMSYLNNTLKAKGNGFVSDRFGEMIIDLYKMPVVLLSGVFQKENMTTRSSNITAFNKVKIVSFEKGIEGIKIFFSLILWLSALSGLVLNKEKKIRILIVYLFLGLFIRICFPANLFYFYYYLSIFPLVFLVLAVLIKNVEKKLVFMVPIVIFILCLSISSWYPLGLYKDPKPERYFLSVSKIIADDSIYEDKVAIANNTNDKSRWEHNGLEYRYFAESMFNLKAGNWEPSDYKQANVLYFIDEGEVINPLTFGGAEVEAFKPAKIDKMWRVETGQKVYKMSK